MRAGRSGPVGLLLCLIPLLLAMGGGGAPSSDTIPRPKDKYTAELLDRQGVVTRVSDFSCGGRTFLAVARGEGTLMVPFAKIVRVRIGAEKGAAVGASVRVKAGKTLEVTVSPSLLCTGSTEFGNYQVEVGGLKEITFVKP